jgi:Bardet-Biedl syndrome 2 protein
VSAYDVCKNLDVFFKDVTDGVGALSVGVIQSIGKPVLVVGGNCSILGFNNEGSEVFWTVNSDNVSSLAFSDIDSDGIVQLIVGSEDYEIRIFKGAELLSEISETDKVILLHSLPGSRFAYGLANGTIGVYNSNGQRLWKVKTKSVPTSLISCCITGKGNAEVATGWLNGNFTIRNSSDGTLLYKGSAESPIVALFYYDFKLEGKPQFILCTQSGEITGYTLAQADSISAINSAQGIISGGSKITSRTDDQQIIDQLFNTKLELLTQMNLIEKALHQFKNNGPSPRILLADTKVQFEIKPSLDDCCLHLVAMSSNEALISSLIIIDAGNIASALSLLSYKNKYVYVYMYDVDNAVTKGAGTLVWIPTTASKTAVLDLYPVKFQNCTLLIQAT